MKSDDLVNWKVVSYAYETLGDNDALNLNNGKNAYGVAPGQAASVITMKHSMFLTFSSTTGKTYIWSAKDPEKGP